MKKIINISIVIFILLIGILTLSAFKNNNPNIDIIGVWINEEDSKFKLEFKTNGKCYWYYTGENTDIYSYTIYNFSNSLNTSTDFCGNTVKTGDTEDYYIKLVLDTDNNELCYEIFGLTNNNLSLNYLGTSKISVFDKQ